MKKHPTLKKFIGREEELGMLVEFLDEPGSGFTYVRGRRRVGKSWLLKKLVRSRSECFYFSGAKDESDENTRRRFAEELDRHLKQKKLSELNVSSLTWSRIFSQITQDMSDGSTSLAIILDEIQWIAKKQSGFVGLLKNAWVDWEALGNIKVVVCGSSNKFFTEQTGGEEKILRGLKTRSSIWIYPFTLTEVHENFFPSWSFEEVCLLYMAFGGVPYYLQRVNPNNGVIRGVNEAAFTAKSIFLEEIDEVLGLEFNERGVGPVKSILSTLGQDGTTQKTVVEKTGLSQSHVSETLNKLIDYQIVYKKLPLHQKPQKNEAGFRYYMKDFFLNFYFQILEPRKERIRNNKTGLLFPYECLQSGSGFYIPNFSGKAFELLVRSVLEDKRYMTSSIFTKLLLDDERYRVETFWSKSTQIDLVVEHPGDRISRIIECKWISKTPGSIQQIIQELIEKNYVPPLGFQKKHYLILSQPISEEATQSARAQRVEVLYLDSLIG